jgi:ATP-dependent DNA helicase RecG
VSEYPEFSWKEAIVNAAAHRDYNVEGRTTELWFFDDRLEVVNPGGLLPDVNLEELLALHRIHVSRNPRTVRVLVDLGIVRDQGEGIPRMFAEMEGFFLPAPVLDPREHLFRVTLRNTATLTADDKSFVARLGDAELTDVEFRALLEAHRAGRLDNARLRAISGLDTLGASALLRRLRDRELLALHAAGPNSYYELGPKARHPVDVVGLEPGTHGLSAEDTQGLSPGSQGFEPDAQGFEPDAQGFEPDAQGFEPDAQGFDQGTQGSVPDVTSLIAALPDDLRLELTKLGTKPTAPRLRKVLLDLCALRWWTPRELVEVLGLTDAANLSRKQLWPLVTEGMVERRYPENPAHPQQAYRAVGAGAAP